MAADFPNPQRDLDIQVCDANRSPQNSSSKWSLRQIIIKLSKIRDKEEVLKTAREKILIYNETP